jgi:hypothetical protein
MSASGGYEAQPHRLRSRPSPATARDHFDLAGRAKLRKQERVCQPGSGPVAEPPFRLRLQLEQGAQSLLAEGQAK